MDFNNGTFTSEELTLQFDMEYKVANADLPKNVIFDSIGFIRPHTTFSAGKTLCQLIEVIILQLRKPNRRLHLQLFLIHMSMAISLALSLHAKRYD